MKDDATSAVGTESIGRPNPPGYKPATVGALSQRTGLSFDQPYDITQAISEPPAERIYRC